LTKYILVITLVIYVARVIIRRIYLLFNSNGGKTQECVRFCPLPRLKSEGSAEIQSSQRTNHSADPMIFNNYEIVSNAGDTVRVRVVLARRALGL